MKRTPSRAWLAGSLSWILFFLAPVSASCLGNAIPEGEFESTIAPWHLHQEKGAQASSALDAAEGASCGKAAKVSVDKAGEAHHVQFFCNFPSSALSPGEPYRLRFIAKAKPARVFSVRVMHCQRPWSNVGLETEIEAENEWREFDLLFRLRTPQQEEIRVDFFLGAAQGDTWIDRVELVPYDASSAPVEGPLLESDRYTLQFDGQGAIGRLIQETTGQLLVGGLALPPAYRITVTEGVETRVVTSQEAASVRCLGRDKTRRFVFAHRDMEVTCTASRKAKDGLVYFRVKVDNRGRGAVTSIAYPILHCPVKLGETSEDDAILYPRCDGGLIEDPLSNLPGPGLDETYPGPLSCQLMSYYDRNAGLYLAAYDDVGHPKRLGCRMGVDLELSVTHLFPILPGKDARLSYPVVLGTFEGNWYDAAEIYRRWSREQPWCKKTLLERKDTPRWIWQGGLVTPYNPRARTAEGERRFAPDGLTAFLLELRNDYGLPVIPNNRGWERHGEWTPQEYFPPYPDEESFRTDAALIKEAGGQGMIMLSGYRWTIEKARPDGSLYSSENRFEREVRPFVTFAADGEEPNLFASTNPKDWRGIRYARLCPFTSFAQDTVVEAAKHCVQAGYPIVHFDQEVSGPASTSFCGSRDHGHPPGYGPWMSGSMADLYKRIRKTCEPLDPAFALSMEEPNELFLRWLNLCQSRPNGLTSEFPIRRPMTRVVPLFSFLYHDYLVGWTAFYPWRSGGHPTYSLAKGFCAGMMPGIHKESLAPWTEKQRKNFKTLFRRCCQVYAGEGRDFLVFGKMLKPWDLDVPTRELRLGKAGTVSVPAVFHSLWELPDRRTAVLLVNPETEPHDVWLDRLEKNIHLDALSCYMIEF